MTTQREIRGTPREGLMGATLGFFFGFAAVALFGPTAKIFKEAMGLDARMVGLLVAMPALSGSLLRIPFAAWVDTTGGRKPFLALMFLSLFGMLGLTTLIALRYPDNLTQSLYPLLLVLGLLCGCGIATFSVGISQVAYWHPQKKQGSALGFFGGAGNLAPGIFSFILPVALASLGLKGSYLMWLVFLVIGTALYMKMGRNSWYFQYRAMGNDIEESRRLARTHGQEFFPAGSSFDSLRISATIWKTWALVAIYFTTFGGFIALTAWFPTYWQERFETSVVLAGTLTAVFSLLASILRIPGGGVADRFGGERTAVVSLTAMLLGATLLSFSASMVMSICGVVLMGGGMGIANAAVFKLVPQEVPQAVGGAAGWVGGLGAFGGFAIPPVMGEFVSMKGSDGYALGFVTFIALAAFSIGIALLLAWRRRLSQQVAP
ncbi:MAG: transporter, family, nitrate/nitrite transporter [Candidatus Sumerlaeota bacterium]|nr:transporter, family, nitrate/nitrite transporter [Candidatus Sumerlaeota bacterium]